MSMNDNTLCIADPNFHTVWGFAETQEEAEEKLKIAIEKTDESIATWQSHCEKYPDTETFKTYLESEKKKLWKIMTFGEFQKQERDSILNRPLVEIDEERFNEMLNILPPLKWCTIDGVEMFCISEMYTGSYTDQYARAGDKYYTKMVDSLDKSTWINEVMKKGN